MNIRLRAYLPWLLCCVGCPNPAQVSPDAQTSDSGPVDVGADAAVTDSGVDTSFMDVRADTHDAAAGDQGTVADDSAAIDAAAETAALDTGVPDAVSLCANVVCAPRACTRARCDESSGLCVYEIHNEDTCDDGDACTENDVCLQGTCSGEPRHCGPPSAPCEQRACSNGQCQTQSTTCSTSSVTVHVMQNGNPLLYVPVRARTGNRDLSGFGTTIWDGSVALVVPNNVPLRFRGIVNGIPYDTSIDCVAPSCTDATLEVPTASPLRALTWDPFMNPEASGGERISRGNSFIEREGFYVEFWAVDAFRTANPVLTTGHAHQGNACFETPGSCGNPSNSEDHHAFGTIQQGILVALTSGLAFDLVSVDFRIRSDAEPEHVNLIPGADPSRVSIWVASDLTSTTLPTAVFSARNVGTRAAMSSFETLKFTRVENVRSVFISSTWNVSLDNIVVRPRP